MMKKLLVLALGLGFLACQPGKKNDLTLDATLENVEDGTPVYISELKKGNQPEPLDTVEVSNGKISVDLPKVDFQTLNILTIKDVQGNMLFVNENEPIKATVYKDSLRQSKIDGGPANQMFMDYTARLMDNQKELMKMREGLSKEDYNDPEVKNRFMKKQQEMQKENLAFRKKLIKENPDKLPAVFVFSDLMRSNDVAADDLEKMFNSLSKEVKNTYMGKQIGEQLKKSQAIAVGKKAPGFSAKTPDGDELALNDALGKYTLVDFWASWCKPCRKENPNVVKVYDKYHDKGLNILGVSLDKKHDPWVKAIEKDELEWQQISNLKFWQDPIAKKYNVRAIPANFLLDEDGKIVAKNLRGNKLKQKMDELLGDQ